MQGVCGNETATTVSSVQADWGVSLGQPAPPHIALLTVKLSCPWTFLPLMNVLGDTGMAGMSLEVVATQPFVSN
jgi:hypothetical protein